MEVKDPTFVKSQPVCGISISAENSSILVFGGNNELNFVFSSKEIIKNQINIKVLPLTFNKPTGFC